jgi:hypothetical protein
MAPDSFRQQFAGNPALVRRKADEIVGVAYRAVGDDLGRRDGEEERLALVVAIDEEPTGTT